jgi:protein-S-isoprenylcysteine O-methyltransferase Ste14
MSRLPSLGPRGEGWVAIQFALLCAIGATAFLGPAWGGDARIVSTASGAVLFIAGLVLAVRGMSDLREALTPLPYPRQDAQLVETGVYRLVRHPIYGGLILAALGWGLCSASAATLALAVVLLGFFELKSRLEENWLEERFPDYPAYRARTRRLIPWIG